jgi:glyoxylase-like metal-dependent hydrolase (beta-lactamase superfamily II)
MRTRLDRRAFMSATAATVFGATTPLRRLCAQAAAAELGIVAIAEDVILITGAGANICALQNDDALLLVDGGAQEYAAAVLEALDTWSGGKPVEIMFNTNWRPEHTGLNETLAARGTRILAHENTRLWMTIPFDVEWEQAHYDERPAAAQPTETFYGGGQLQFGNVVVRYDYYPQAHTDGDICVHIPHRDVLVASDLMTVASYPIVDYVTGGWIGGMRDALTAMLESTTPSTRIVPAVGPVQTQTSLRRQLEMCTSVSNAVREAYRNGRSQDEFRASAPTAAFDAERGDPDLFLNLVFKGTWGHVRELGAGII